jgi:hypothetical protein
MALKLAAIGAAGRALEMVTLAAGRMLAAVRRAAR